MTKKGSFLSGRNLGDAPIPTADAIRELNQQLTGKTVEPPSAPEPEPVPLPPSAPEVLAAAVPEPVRERKVRITIDIPEGLHEMLKIYTFRQKTTMKDLFLDYAARLVAGAK